MMSCFFISRFGEGSFYVMLILIYRLDQMQFIMLAHYLMAGRSIPLGIETNPSILSLVMVSFASSSDRFHTCTTSPLAG